jgi:hypothetical protein
MTPTKPTKFERRRLYPYVSGSLGQRLAETCAARGVTESAVVEEALEQYLGGANDLKLVMQRLDRLSGEMRHQKRDLELLSEAFAASLKFSFAHTRPVPEESRMAALALADALYKQFVVHIVQQYSSGARFLDALRCDQVESTKRADHEAMEADRPTEP